MTNCIFKAIIPNLLFKLQTFGNHCLYNMLLKVTNNDYGKKDMGTLSTCGAPAQERHGPVGVGTEEGPKNYQGAVTPLL